MIGVAILQLASKTLEISLIQPRYLNFGELYFPFIVIDYLFNFVFELKIVLFDKLQPMLLTCLQLFVDLQNTSDLFLLGTNDRT